MDLTNGAGRRRQECGQAAAPLTAPLPPPSSPPPQKKAQELEVCGGKAVFLWPLSFFSWSGVEAQLGRTTIKGGAARYWAVPGRLPWGWGGTSSTSRPSCRRTRIPPARSSSRFRVLGTPSQPFHYHPRGPGGPLASAELRTRGQPRSCRYYSGAGDARERIAAR